MIFFLLVQEQVQGKAIFTVIVMANYILPDFLYVQIFINTIHILYFLNYIHIDIGNGFL